MSISSHEALIPVVSGAIAGATSLLVVYPADTIRTRLQTQKGYAGVIDCFQKTVSKEGFFALYKGLLVPFAAQGVYKAVIFGSVHQLSQIIFSLDRDNGKTQQKRKLTPGEAYFCGTMAGSINAFIATPVELIRNRLMVNRNNNDPSATVRKVIRGALQEGGFFSMWKGLIPCIARDGLGAGAYFFGNNLATKWLNAHTDLGPASTQIFAGMCAGMSYWTMALPIDRVKSIIQTQKVTSGATLITNPGELFRYIFRTEGIRGLYRGLGVGWGRGIPGGATTFFVNHQMLAFFETKRQQRLKDANFAQPRSRSNYTV